MRHGYNPELQPCPLCLVVTGTKFVLLLIKECNKMTAEAEKLLVRLANDGSVLTSCHLDMADVEEVAETRCALAIADFVLAPEMKVADVERKYEELINLFSESNDLER